VTGPTLDLLILSPLIVVPCAASVALTLTRGLGWARRTWGL
jgi:hypothetical protein